MSEPNKDTSIDSTVDIHIVTLNREKTRTTGGPKTEYQIYFELSASPPQLWRIIFEQEWASLSPQAQSERRSAEASIDGKFLVLHSLLEETALHLPILKEAIIVANAKFKQHVQEQASEQVQREDVWKQERKAVDDMAESLHLI